MNSVNMIGNLVRDVDIKYGPTGTAIGKTAIALNERYKDEERVSFVDLTVFGKTAENMNTYFRKGSKIGITGRIQQERWEAQGGEKRSKVGVIVERFSFVTSRSDDNNNSNQGNEGGYDNPPNSQAYQEAVRNQQNPPPAAPPPNAGTAGV